MGQGDDHRTDYWRGTPRPVAPSTGLGTFLLKRTRHLVVCVRSLAGFVLHPFEFSAARDDSAVTLAPQGRQIVAHCVSTGNSLKDSRAPERGGRCRTREPCFLCLYSARLSFSAVQFFGALVEAMPLCAPAILPAAAFSLKSEIAPCIRARLEPCRTDSEKLTGFSPWKRRDREAVFQRPSYECTTGGWGVQLLRLVGSGPKLR